MKYVIYPKPDGGIYMLIPSQEWNVNDVALKDVPIGVPYKIVDSSQFPPHFEFFAAWEVDFSEPDGHGIGENEFWKSKEITQ
jgi:hypothetical protein